MNDNKTCARCKQEKPQNDFYRYPKGRLHPYCKPCAREYTRERAAKRSESVAQ